MKGDAMDWAWVLDLPRQTHLPSKRSWNSSRRSTDRSPGSIRPGSPASATGRLSSPRGDRPPAARPGPTEFKADLAAFVKELARTYFKTVRDGLKAADPDHLYLGCRFAWRTEEAVAAAAEFCDVVSFNIYDRRVDPKKWAFLTDLGRPVIIGEFHAGALDRGMFHPGLVSAATSKNARQSTQTTSPASWTTLPWWVVTGFNTWTNR